MSFPKLSLSIMSSPSGLFFRRINLHWNFCNTKMNLAWNAKSCLSMCIYIPMFKPHGCVCVYIYTSLHIMLLGDIGWLHRNRRKKTRWKLTNSTVLGLLHGLLDCFYGCKLFVCLLLNSHSFRKQIAPRGRESTPQMYKQVLNMNIYKWNNLSTYWEHWYAWRETTTVHLVKSY